MPSMPRATNKLLLPLVVALFAPVLASPSSARALENRVWGSNFARATCSGLQHDSTPGTHWTKVDSPTILASEYLLAPRAVQRLLPGVKFGGRKFGQKVAQHGREWGLNPASAADRATFKRIVERIVEKGAGSVRQGPWHPKTPAGGSDFLFYPHRGNVVVTQPDGSFVTIMRDALNNAWFRGANPL
jgi:filamentous hemagglutinin